MSGHCADCTDLAWEGTRRLMQLSQASVTTGPKAGKGDEKSEGDYARLVARLVELDPKVLTQTLMLMGKASNRNALCVKFLERMVEDAEREVKDAMALLAMESIIFRAWQGMPSEDMASQLEALRKADGRTHVVVPLLLNNDMATKIRTLNAERKNLRDKLFIHVLNTSPGVTKEPLRMLVKEGNLATLRVAGNDNVDAESFKYLRDAKSLDWLEIAGCSNVSFAELEAHLRSMKAGLKRLVLIPADDKLAEGSVSLTALSKMNAAETLVSVRATQGGAQQVDNNILLPNAFPALKELDIGSFASYDLLGDLLAAAPELKELTLRQLTREHLLITPLPPRPLSSTLVRLRLYLDSGGGRGVDWNVASIARVCPGLQYLTIDATDDVDGTFSSANAADVLAAAPNLRSLEIRGMKDCEWLASIGADTHPILIELLMTENDGEGVPPAVETPGFADKLLSKLGSIVVVDNGKGLSDWFVRHVHNLKNLAIYKAHGFANDSEAWHVPIATPIRQSERTLQILHVQLPPDEGMANSVAEAMASDTVVDLALHGLMRYTVNAAVAMIGKMQSDEAYALKLAAKDKGIDSGQLADVAGVVVGKPFLRQLELVGFENLTGEAVNRMVSESLRLEMLTVTAFSGPLSLGPESRSSLQQVNAPSSGAGKKTPRASLGLPPPVEEVEYLSLYKFNDSKFAMQD